MEKFNNILLEIFYILIGMMFLYTSIYCFRDKNNKTSIGSGLFWGLLSVTFILGPYIPSWISGLIIIILGILTATKQVNVGTIVEIKDSFMKEQSNKLKNKIFLPSISIALFALLLAQFTPVSGTASIGLSAIIALVVLFLVTKTPPKNVAVDGDRLLQATGPFSILPQLLASLGALFTAAGVGDVITSGISSIIPEKSKFLGVLAYCLGMAIFTIIMGNAFAAFSVVTVGIGLPFVIMQGANPAIAGAIALTAGYCGTLLTPMAANFNIVPAALLDMKNKYNIIKYQAPIALIALLGHILLMYFLAF